MSHPYRDHPVAETHVWLTPPSIINALGKFDLDPCAAPSPRPWDTAKRHIELPENGLSATWKGRVWLNPPYGDQTAIWLQRLAAHGNGIALVFARTETQMFFRSVWPCADAFLFLEKRPCFHHSDGSRARGNSGGPLMLIAYGESNAIVLKNCGIPGHYIENGKKK